MKKDEKAKGEVLAIKMFISNARIHNRKLRKNNSQRVKSPVRKRGIEMNARVDLPPLHTPTLTDIRLLLVCIYNHTHTHTHIYS